MSSMKLIFSGLIIKPGAEVDKPNAKREAYFATDYNYSQPEESVCDSGVPVVD